MQSNCSNANRFVLSYINFSTTNKFLYVSVLDSFTSNFSPQPKPNTFLIFLRDQNLFSLSINTTNIADPVTIEMLSQKSAGESRMNDILDQMHN